MELIHHYSPIVYVVFLSILPFIYTQNAQEDHVDIQNVARKEVGFFTQCAPTGGGGKNNAPAKNNDIEPDDGNVTSKPEDYVKGHNVARKEVGADPVEWNTTLAEYAQSYANQRKDCKLIHSETEYGENLCWGGVAQDAINMWVGEKPDWDAATQTCAPGKVCGHYTQVIAPDSTQIGCARVKCTTEKYAYFVTCNYFAPPKDKKDKAEKKPSCGDRRLF